jgi:hypothetical protein
MMHAVFKSTILILSICFISPVYAWVHHYDRHYDRGNVYHHSGVYVEREGYHRGAYARNVRVPGRWVYHPRTHTKVWVPAHWERR